jgi:hypothetical protein
VLERGLRESVQAGRSSSREERFASCRTFDPVWRSWPWAARRRASPCRPVSQFHKPRLPPATMPKVGWSAATCRAQKQQQQTSHHGQRRRRIVSGLERDGERLEAILKPSFVAPGGTARLPALGVCNFAAAIIKVECHRALLSPEGDLDCGGRCSYYYASDRRLLLQEREQSTLGNHGAASISFLRRPYHLEYRQRRVRRAMFTPV